MSVTRPVVKTQTLQKNKNQTSLGISLPLESGQLERWYFHLGASNGISVLSQFTTRNSSKNNKHSLAVSSICKYSRSHLG